MTGTVLITGPTKNLGRHAVLSMARRKDKPDLLLVGRRGEELSSVAAEARALGANVQEIGCDLASLADVRAAAATVRELLDSGAVRPLRALVANAGLASAGRTSADGYELTFAVNHLAHAQLISDLLDRFTAPARIVLLGSNTYYQNFWRKLLGVPAARWADPEELARAGAEDPMAAYSTAKLAILYYAHELQRRVGDGVGVSVFEPGWMPATGLGRNAPPAVQAVLRVLGRLPGVSKPQTSGPLLASVALDSKWAHLRDGAFVLKNRVTDVEPLAHNRDRERRLWEATAALLAPVSRG